MMRVKVLKHSVEEVELAELIFQLGVLFASNEFKDG
jgi:hypothetical protein